MNIENNAQNSDGEKPSSPQSLIDTAPQTSLNTSPLPSTVASSPRRTRAARDRRRNGKVARLPLPVRNMVNQALRDGVRYTDIIAMLVTQGYPGFKPPHLSSWSKGGYRAWLASQETMERSIRYSDQTTALLGSLRADGNSNLPDLCELRLTSQLLHLLDSVDEAAIRDLVAEDPGEYFRLARVLTATLAARAQREHAALVRLKFDRETRRLEEQERRRLEPKGMTTEEMNALKARIKLI